MQTRGASVPRSPARLASPAPVRSGMLGVHAGVLGGASGGGGLLNASLGAGLNASLGAGVNRAGTVSPAPGQIGKSRLGRGRGVDELE